MRRSDSAFAVIRRGRQVLLVKARGKGTWHLPGGCIKPGETPLAAVAREVHEETALHPRIEGLSGLYRRLDGSLAFVFTARIDGACTLPGPRYEIEKQRWMSLAKAAAHLSAGARVRLLDSFRRPGTLRLGTGRGQAPSPLVRFRSPGRRAAGW